jgi:hypothetical protein
MHEAVDEYPVNSANSIQTCYLHGSSTLGIVSSFFPSLFAVADRFALSTAFSTEIDPLALPAKSKISFTSYSYYWGFRRGYRKVLA